MATYNYTTINGQRVEVNVASAFYELAAAFKKRWRLDLLVTSGTRTRAEQQYYYLGWVNKKPGFNLAAPPGYSNHEESGPVGPRALDVRDSGSDPGVTVYGTPRAKWLRANASKYGFDPAGYNPNWSQIEPWHIEFRGKIGGNAPSSSQLSPGLAWPFAWYTVKKGDTLSSIAEDHAMSESRLSRLNPSIKYPNKLEIGARVKVALDQIKQKLVEDGILGEATYTRWEQELGVEVNRSFGRDDVRKLQRTMNKKRAKNKQIPVTGVLDSPTIKAVQEWIASPGLHDGITSNPSVWVKKLQKQFNNGSAKWQ